MFQYAAGRAVADRLGIPLKLDLRSFERYSLHHGFELQSVFGVEAASATPEEIAALLRWRRLPLVVGALRARSRYFGPSGIHIYEPPGGYWAGFHRLSGSVYLDGYWQSELYFARAARRIREDFSFRSPLDADNTRLSDLIYAVDAVSLHVRRGDYVSDPRTARKHGTCSPQFYKDALRIVLDGLENPHVFVFSDDMTWVRENIAINVPVTYVEQNTGTQSFQDMRLMSLCRRHIIANSSFSWWGAWLGEGPYKIVVAPAKWFVDPRKQALSEDICPVDWVRL